MPVGWQPGLALRAPPGEPLEASWRPKRLFHDPVPPRALLFLVDLRVLLFALEFALKPVCAELHRVIHEGLKVLRTEERTERKGMDPSSVQGFILNDVPWEEAGRGQGKEKEHTGESPVHKISRADGSWHDGGRRVLPDDLEPTLPRPGGSWASHLL